MRLEQKLFSLRLTRVLPMCLNNYLVRLLPKSNLQIGLALRNVGRSQFVRQATLLFLLNVIAKGFSFFGNAYAARSLGPTNLGISGLVQATVRQVALTYDGGFNTVGVRKIAADKENSREIIETINTFQLGMAFVVSLVWLLFVLGEVPLDRRFVWMLGVPSLVFSATSIAFVFQGLEKLPVQAAINTLGALLTSSLYFLFFSPGMFLGADLVVMATVNLVGTVVAWGAYWRMFGRLPIGKLRKRQLFSLLHESWRYWVLTIVVFFYSTFQVPLVANLLGSREVGIFRSALLMASAVEMLFESVNSLLLARLVVWNQQQPTFLWRQQSRLFWIFLLIGLPIVAVLLWIAPVVYKMMLGEAFVEGTVIFQILIIGRLIVFLGQIYAWGVVALGKDNQLLIASILGAAISITFTLLFASRFGLVSVAIVSVISELAVHMYCYLAVRSDFMENTNTGIG